MLSSLKEVRTSKLERKETNILNGEAGFWHESHVSCLIPKSGTFELPEQYVDLPKNGKANTNHFIEN